jgi:nitroreductase
VKVTVHPSWLTAEPVAAARRRLLVDGLPTAPDVATALHVAALLALLAPSVHNTQPWRWLVGGDVLELHADERWRLRLADPDGRLLILSCGTALHHVRVALRAMGYLPSVQRFPVPSRPGLLARVTVARPIPVSRHATALAGAALRRHTERRALTGMPPPTAIDALRRTAGSEGAWLHLLNPAQTARLLATAERAETALLADPERRREIASWVGVPEDATAGVPHTVMPPRGGGYQSTGSHAVLYGNGDRPSSWLRAGEALSAVWLAAAVQGLSVQPISSVIEVPAGRAALHQVLSGVGCPYLVLRIGVPVSDNGISPTPRRPATESIEVGGPDG